MAVISPDTFDPLLRYISVRLQQGVPIVDADINEADDIRSFELRSFLKWFVGDGVPETSDAFRVVASGLKSDVVIAAGAAAPPGSGKLAAGLGAGRCLVDGRDAMIAKDVNLTGQRLHVSQQGAAKLAGAWGVSTVTDLPLIDGKILLYLDVWDRLVTPTEQPALIFSGLGTESAARLGREWVVRWTAAAVPPAFGTPEFKAGHSYTALASIARRAADPVIGVSDVTDLRQRRLLVPPATLIEDLLGTTPTRYRQGLDRPPISMRDAVNALLRGELPSTPDSPIAPHPANDAMSFAFDRSGPDIVGFWSSMRVAGLEQIFATRWPQGDPAAAASTPPNQVTSGTLAHRLPSALQLPNAGDLLVAYETDTRDIHARRAATLAGFASADELPIATDPDPVVEAHPLVLIVGNQLVYLWHSTSPGPKIRWMYRRRKYPAAWTELGASWLDAAGVELSPIVPAAAAPSAGGVHAVVAGTQIYVAFVTSTDDIAVARLDPLTAAIENWGGLLLTSPVKDSSPYLVVDGTASVWAFWQTADQGIFHRRHDVASNTWVGGSTVVPGTHVAATTDTRTTAVRDGTGAIWLFWVSNRSGSNDVWVVRRDPATGGWGAPRVVAASAQDDDLPFARGGDGDVIWLFWRSQRSGNNDLYFKRLITSI
jgi:hypothetical protein